MSRWKGFSHIEQNMQCWYFCGIYKNNRNSVCITTKKHKTDHMPNEDSCHLCVGTFWPRPQKVYFGSRYRSVISALSLRHLNTVYKYYDFLSWKLTKCMKENWYSQQNHINLFHFTCPLRKIFKHGDNVSVSCSVFFTISWPRLNVCKVRYFTLTPLYMNIWWYR